MPSRREASQYPSECHHHTVCHHSVSCHHHAASLILCYHYTVSLSLTLYHHHTVFIILCVIITVPPSYSPWHYHTILISGPADIMVKRLSGLAEFGVFCYPNYVSKYQVTKAASYLMVPLFFLPLLYAFFISSVSATWCWYPNVTLCLILSNMIEVMVWQVRHGKRLPASIMRSVIYWFSSFLSTPNCVHGLLLPPCSRTTPGRAQEPYGVMRIEPSRQTPYPLKNLPNPCSLLSFPTQLLKTEMILLELQQPLWSRRLSWV